MNQFFSDGKEFSLIESLFDPKHFSKTGDGLGDDAFIWTIGDQTWSVSTDTSVEGIHYREDWGGLSAGLEKAILSNLSDINAIGGETVFALFNLGARRNWDAHVIDDFSKTLKKLENEFHFRIVGGDTVTKDTESFFTFTVIGRVKGKPLLRSSARPGHKIYCTGQLGASAAGLALYSQGFHHGHSYGMNEQFKPFLEAHNVPKPPLLMGPLLSLHKDSVAAIDVSDGLSSELHHLSVQSSCRMVVDWSKLLYRDSFGPSLQALPQGKDWKNWILNGGEDYQLIFTGNFTESELSSLREKSGAHFLKEIGHVEVGQGVGLVNEKGEVVELMAHGWSH